MDFNLHQSRAEESLQNVDLRDEVLGLQKPESAVVEEAGEDVSL